MASRAGRLSRTLAALLLASASGAGSVACGGGRAGRNAAMDSPAAAADRRQALLARVLAAPDDVAAWLELSAEEDRAGRPSAALDALEQAGLHHAPLGADLDEADRQRQARLLAARGRARLARGAASALGDLREAKAGGAAVQEGELLAAEVAAALAEARHSDQRRRAQGLAALGRLADRGGAAEVARGEKAGASVAERVAWATWLWRRGAKRAAYDRIAALHQLSVTTRTPTLLDDAARSLGAEMSAWWRPSWRGAAPAPRMAAAIERRCAVVPLAGAAASRCAPSQVVTAGARSSAAERDVLLLPLAHQEPARLASADRSALIVMLVRGFLEGELDDAPRALQRLVDVPHAAGSEDAARETSGARALILRLAGSATAAAALQQADAAPPAVASELVLLAYEHLARADVAGAEPYLAQLSSLDGTAPAVVRLRAVAEALRAPLQGANGERDAAALAALSDAAAVRAALADAAAGGAALVDGEVASPLREAGPARAAPAASTSAGDDRAAGGAGDDRAAGGAGDDRAAGGAGDDRAAGGAGDDRAAGGAGDDRAARLLDIAARYRSDVAVARRKAADYVATSVDAAAAWAQLGALYLLLEDPASARAAWQAAVAKSAEPRFLQGLAVACAAARDPDAALLFMINAAAASGDPTPVLLDVAEELLRAGSPVPALQAAKSALDLAPLELYAAALDVAVRAARALDRQEEIAALRQLGAATDVAAALADASSPSSMERALAADLPHLPELLWIATRWHPRSVPLRAQALARLPSGDARRGVLVGELAALAGDPDRRRRAAAVAALRGLSAATAP